MRPEDDLTAVGGEGEGNGIRVGGVTISERVSGPAGLRGNGAVASEQQSLTAPAPTIQARRSMRLRGPFAVR